MFPRTLVIVALLATQLAVTCALVARSSRAPAGAQLSFVFTTVPVPVAAPPAAPSPSPPPPVSTRPTCPPVRSDAAAIPPGHALPHGVNRVTASMTNAGWLAAWNEAHVLVSTDGGLSFTQMLDGPGTVRDVTFDCFGHAIVLRGDRVGIRDGGHESWRPVPGIEADDDTPAVLIGGGPDVVAIGVDGQDDWQARLAVSSDLGQSWWFRDLSSYWEESRASGREDPDGTIHVAITTADCMSDPSTWLRIHPDGKVDTDDLGDVGHIALFDDYAISGWDHPRWKRFGEADWHDLPGLAESFTLAAGPLPRAITDRGIYTLDRHRARPLRPWHVSDAAVDRAGRLWGIGETSDGEDAWLVAVPNARAPLPPPDPDDE